jgi:hypothetical protein
MWYRGMQTAYIRRETEDPEEDMEEVQREIDYFVDGRGGGVEVGLNKLADVLLSLEDWNFLGLAMIWSALYRNAVFLVIFWLVWNANSGVAYFKGNLLSSTAPRITLDFLRTSLFNYYTTPCLFDFPFALVDRKSYRINRHIRYYNVPPQIDDY